jgi:hypothetical protein
MDKQPYWPDRSGGAVPHGSPDQVWELLLLTWS